MKVFTDEYSVYDPLKEELGDVVETHERVNHSEKEFARGDVHVNTCENRHGFLRAYLMKYRGVSFRWLQGYLDFPALILNNRWGCSRK
ncbi:transposase [Thermococcus sp.]